MIVAAIIEDSSVWAAHISAELILFSSLKLSGDPVNLYWFNSIERFFASEAASNYDLILCDIHVEDGNTFPFLERICERGPVCMQTSSSHPSDEKKARRLGARWYLVKRPALANSRSDLRSVFEEVFLDGPA